LAERYLPTELLKRPKQGFSSALPYMLRDEFRLLFGAFLRDSHLVRDGFYTQVPVRRVLDDHLRGKTDHGNRLWLLLNSEVWYRMLLEGATAANISEQIATAQKAAG
jgi:asparagine synthase (glutamine-hydrolysing)